MNFPLEKMNFPLESSVTMASSSSSNSINEIRSTKKRKRHHYNLRSCPESNFGGRFSSIKFQMAQEWNHTDELFISSIKVQIAKCAQVEKFSANNWAALRKSLNMSKEQMVTRLKKLRREALHFEELLAEEHVTCNSDGVLCLPNYFWEDDVNGVKYAVFKKERNFKSLKEWCSIFATKKIPFDDDTRSVNSTKCQRNEVMAESSKKSKSSLERNRLLEIQQCDTIFKNWKNSGHISMVGAMKLHEALKDKGDANYFLGLDLIEDRWCYAIETLREVAVLANRDITDYVIKDVEDLVN